MFSSSECRFSFEPGHAGHGAPVAVPLSRENAPERISSLCDKVCDRVAKSGDLPERLRLGLGFLGESRQSNGAAMNRLLETLAMEIEFSTKLDAIHTFRKDEPDISRRIAEDAQ